MRTTTEKEVVKKVKTTRYTCDRCGKPCGDDEARCSYDVLNVSICAKIERQEGTSFPEGTSIEQISIDCCTVCFDEIILPAIKELGFKTYTDEIDW